MVGVRAKFLFPFVGFGFLLQLLEVEDDRGEAVVLRGGAEEPELGGGEVRDDDVGNAGAGFGRGDGGVFVDLEAEDAVVVDEEGEEQGFGIGLGTGFGGEILAKQLASLGAKLIISARNEVELNRVRIELKGKHAPNEVKILPLDLSSGEDSLRNAVEKAESLFPDSGVDYTIHNAAFERPMSSAAGKTPAPGQAVYSTTKYALNGYFHTLRSES